MASPQNPNDDLFQDVLLGYRPRSAWDNLSPEERQFAPPNPFPDPLGQTLRRDLGLPGWRSQPIDYITPEDQETVLQKLATGAATSAGAVGNFLDKYTGSRAIRGLAAGKWREVLSTLPLSDKLGITDPTQSTSGKEVFGIKDDPNSYMDDVKGIAAEVLMDPTLFMGGFLKGGLKAGGKALKSLGGLRDVDWALKSAAKVAGESAGKFTLRKSKTLGAGLEALADRNLADNLLKGLGEKAGNSNILDQWLQAPIGKSLDIGIPFSEKYRKGFNVPGVDWARDAIGASPLLGSSGVALSIAEMLHAPSRAMKTKLGQDIAKQVSYIQGKTPEFLEQALGEASRLKSLGEYTPKNAAATYSTLEGFDKLHAGGPAEEMSNYIKNVLGPLRHSLGIGEDLSDDFIKQYAARYGIMPEAEFVQGAVRSPALDPRGLNEARSAGLKDIEGGTKTIMEMMMDPAVVAASKTKRTWGKQLDSVLQTKYSQYLPRHMADPAKMDALKTILHSTPQEVMERGFYMHPLEAMSIYIKKTADKVAVAQAQIDLLSHGVGEGKKLAAQMAKAGASQAEIDAKLSSVAEMYKPGMNPDGSFMPSPAATKAYNYIPKTAAEAATKGAKSPLVGGTYIEYIKRYGTTAEKQQLAGADAMWKAAVSSGDEAAYAFAKADVEKILGDFEAVTRVPKEVMRDVNHWNTMFEPGGQIGELGKWWDQATNLFKAGVLTWPARYTRDLFSGQVQNMMLNQFSLRGAKDATEYVFRGAIKNPAKYLTHIPAAKLKAMSPQELQKAFDAHIASLGMLGDAHAPLAQVGTPKPKGFEGLVEGMPNPATHTNPFSGAAKEAYKSVKTRSGWNPLNIRGVQGDETLFGPVRAGNVFGQATDNLNRLQAYLTLKGRGMDTNEALRRVMSSQVDYATKTLTAVERNILSRLFPFWRYQSKMLPFVVQEVLDRPGGLMSQTIRMSGRVGGGHEQFTPAQIRSNLAVPLSGMLGSADPTRQRFLSGLGLMHEDATSRYRPGGNLFASAKNTMQSVLGDLNPLVKVPLEVGFGVQANSGRNLLDLDGGIGRIIQQAGLSKDPYEISPLLEHMAAGSPLSRVLSTTRTLLDPAKGAGAKAVNLLSGIRLSDIDMEKAKGASIREAIEERMRGKPGVRSLRPHLYVKEEDRANMNPADLLLMDMYRQQLSEAKKNAMKKARLAPMEQLLLSRTGS